MLATVRKYNQRLASKYSNAKAETDEIKDDWKAWIERIEGNRFSTLDSDAKKQFYLKLIESFYEQNQDLREVIALKELVNNNEGKIKVVSALLAVNSKPGSPQGNGQQFSLNASIQFDSVEDRIREAEEEANRLETEIKNVNAKTANLEKEIKRCRAPFDGRDVDAEIKAAENKIRELEERL